MIQIGTYVLASHWSDCDPNDPWIIGWVVRIIQDARGTAYLIGRQDGTWYHHREYRHCREITLEEGEAWLRQHNEPEQPVLPLADSIAFAAWLSKQPALFEDFWGLQDGAQRRIYEQFLAALKTEAPSAAPGACKCNEKLTEYGMLITSQWGHTG